MKALIATLIFALIATPPVLSESPVEPTIIVYSGTDSGFAEMLAQLLLDDPRIESQVRIVTTPDIIALASSLPQTECMIIYTGNKVEVEGLESNLISFFEQGGGLIGMRDICSVPAVGRIAIDVFPTYANGSVKQFNPRELRVRNHTKGDSTEINEGLPDRFSLLSMGTYLSVDSDGNYLPVSGDFLVPFRDEQTGSPLIIANENDNGGRSVAFPGVWVIPSSRVDIYYGNLVADENFVKLFTNSVLWAAKGSSRFPEVQKDLAEKIEDAKGKQERLKEEAEQARKRENTQRLLLLVGVWVVGLIICAVVVLKLVLAPIEIEG
jgi:hypothetical protein